MKLAGQPITEGLNDGWVYLTNAEAATPFSLCVIIFALLMIPGGRIQDKYGPKVGAITGGLFLAVGCIIAGVMKSYTGLIVGFGIFGGIGMGIGYAAPTPAALTLVRSPQTWLDRRSGGRRLRRRSLIYRAPGGLSDRLPVA